MYSSKKITCKGTLRQVFICLSCTPPPLHNVQYTYMYLFTLRRGGGRVQPKKSLERQHFTKMGRKKNMSECISSLSNLINTNRKVPLQVIFLDDDILLWCPYLVN
jgi:hypothetical protein